MFDKVNSIVTRMWWRISQSWSRVTISDDVNSIVTMARSLPPISDAEIEKGFDNIRYSWHAKKIYIVPENQLAVALTRIIAEDAKHGFGVINWERVIQTDWGGLHPDPNGRLLQLNTHGKDADGSSTFRGHIVVKQQDEQYALFGFGLEHLNKLFHFRLPAANS